MNSTRTSIPAIRPLLQCVRLLAQVRERIRFIHHSLRIGRTCLYRIRAFMRFHEIPHACELADKEAEQFLNARVNEPKISALA